MKKSLFIALLASHLAVGQSQWQSLNPGAGGRVQGVSCDASLPGRMHVASDMEGYYYSDNYGTSWNFAGGNLPTAFILLAQGRGNTFYVGHALGLSVSTDKGRTHTLVPATKDKTIGTIEIDPTNPNKVYAGIEWRGNDNHLRHYPIGGHAGANAPTHAKTKTVRQLFYTKDGGTTWKTTSWANYALGDGRTTSIRVRPGQSAEVMIGTYDGLFVSTDEALTWSKVAAPAEVTEAACYGADFTPDGVWVYAIYQKSDGSHLFAMRYPGGAWQDLGTGNWPTNNNGNTAQPLHMWEPKVFQGSTPTQHYVLMGQLDQNPPDKLYEGRFTVGGSGPTATLSGSIVPVLGYDDARTNPNTPYDIGWNPYRTNARNNVYYPKQWSGAAGNPHMRGVLAMSQQSYFTGDAADGNIGWRVVSTAFVKEINGERFYTHRGAASTYTYDVAALGTYVIQGQADNGVLESWDSGKSWRQASIQVGPDALTDVHGLHVLPGGPGSVGGMVLASAAVGFGGGRRAAGAYLLMKKINPTDPAGKAHGFEVVVDASTNNRRGLPNNRIWKFYSDPQVRTRLYALTEVGLYVCDDIYDLLNGGQSTFRKAKPVGNLPGESLAFMPGASGTIFYKDGTGTFKGERTADGTYTWATMTRAGSQPDKLQTGAVATVARGTNRYVFTYIEDEGIARADNGSTTFTTILPNADALTLLGKPGWWEAGRNKIEVEDIVAVGSTLYVPYQQWDEYRVGFGILKGNVQANGDVIWQNWTADLPYSVASQIKHYDGTIYLPTRGAGLIARKLTGDGAGEKPKMNTKK
jgi:hypothetical protein